LIIKIRLLFNQPMLDDQHLQLAGGVWAQELIKAGIPPRQWDDMATRARQASGHNKAFPPTCDEIIDQWREWLKSEVTQYAFCGDCEHGQLNGQYEIKCTDRWGRETSYDPPQFHRYVAGVCRCKKIFEARQEYPYRRFAADYDIKFGREYEPSDEDLVSLYELMHGAHMPSGDTWRSALTDYLESTPNPTVEGFCASEAFARIHEARRLKAEENQRQRERLQAEDRNRQEKAQKAFEDWQRRQEEQKRQDEQKWEEFKQKAATKAASTPKPENSECPF